MIGRWATAGGMVAILLLTGCAEPPPAPPPEAVVELVDWRTVPALAPEAERADYIWVDKSERLMILYRGADELRRYRIALGAAPAGHKFRQGDERTPTGRYRIEWRNANSIAHLSLRISYPNAVDLARAAAAGSSDLRRTLARELDETTVQDAVDVYAAIRLAAPGGLGEAGEQDVGSEPTVPLLETMRLAADRDGVAREYATAFQVTFDVGLPTLRAARDEALSWDDAIVETFLKVLSAHPDTHIARRAGPERAARVSELASDVVEAGGVRTGPGRTAVTRLDAELRHDGHGANPGTTADLTAASIFALLVETRS